MNKKQLIRSITALALSAVMAAGAVSCAGDLTELANQAETYKVERQDIKNYISVSGTVEGSNIVKVTSEVGTKVKSLNVEIGSSVNEGDVLCIFDSDELQAEYDSLAESVSRSDERLKSIHEINQRSLNNAKSDKDTMLRQAQRAIDNAVSSRDKAYERYNSLGQKKDEASNRADELYAQVNADGEYDETAYKEYLTAAEEYKLLESELTALGDSLSSYDNAVQDARDAYSAAEKSANAAIQAAQDTIDAEKYDIDNSLRTQLDKLKERIEKCTVTAPRSGIITSLNVAEGSIPTAEAIMTIEDTSQLRINVTIDEADILRVKEGQHTEISTIATGDEVFTGKVSRVINIMSGQTSSMITGEIVGGGYSAEITIDGSDTDLLIGMSAKVKIILEEKSDVLAVPYDSIQEDDGSFFVFVADGQEGSYTAREITVEKGLETDYLTEIISSDIKEGDLILVGAGYSDGQNINISGSYYDTQDGE